MQFPVYKKKLNLMIMRTLRENLLVSFFFTFLFYLKSTENLLLKNNTEIKF